jgi:hypothetical protein
VEKGEASFDKHLGFGYKPFKRLVFLKVLRRKFFIHEQIKERR